MTYDNSLDVEVGRRVEGIRKDMGLERKELAGKLGVAIVLLQHYEEGRRIFQPKVAIRLAELSGRSLDYIYRGTSA